MYNMDPKVTAVVGIVVGLLVAIASGSALAGLICGAVAAMALSGLFPMLQVFWWMGSGLFGSLVVLLLLACLLRYGCGVQ